MTRAAAKGQITILSSDSTHNQRDSSSIHKNDGPFFFVGFHGARHLQPDRLPSANQYLPQTVQLLDATKNTVQCFLAISTNVHRILATGLCLKSLPGDLVQGMGNVKKLDLGTNCLTNSGIPCSVGDLQNLVELKLASNKIYSFPNCLCQLKNLKRLDLSDNILKSLRGIENLKKLQFLIVDNNKLQTIFPHIKQLKHLQFLYCSRNDISQIEVDIQFLTSLQVLEMAHNRVVSLPMELFNLRNLNSLNVNNNCISKLPSFNVRFQDKKWMECIDLSNNMISKFPEHLLFLAQKLDLDSNRIKMLNSKVLSKLDWGSDQQLILKRNPLIYPPAEVCSGGLHSMLQFFADDRAEKKTYQGIKIMVFGSCSSGKTSLVQSFVAQQSQLQEKSECIGGVNIYDVTVDKQYEFTKESSFSIESLQLSIWDFCGDCCDVNFHYLFYQRPSITLLCFNALEFKKTEDFISMIGWWLDWIISRTNQLCVILVATHSDLVSNEDLCQIKQQVKCQTQSYLKERKKIIEDELNLISGNPHITAALSKQLKSYLDLLQAKILIADKVVAISSATMSGFSDLYETIENLALNKELFPNVLRVIPTFWVEVGSFLEEKGNNLEIPLMDWDAYSTLITSKFGMKHLIHTVSQYLHDAGKILWFSKHQQLKNYVFLRPSWVMDIFRQIVSAASGQFLESFQEKSQRKMKVSRSKLKDMTDELSLKGILSQEFLQLILSEIISTDEIANLDQIFNLLSEDFEIGYLLDKDSIKKTGSAQYGVIEKHPNLVIPWFCESSPVNTPASAGSEFGINIAFQFKKSIPVGIFELLVCRLYQFEELSFNGHWGDEVQLTCSNHEAVIIIVCQTEATLIQNRNLNVYIRNVNEFSQLEPEKWSALWKPLLSVVMEIESILESFPGEFVKRLVACPYCKELAFTGEWLCPKELQNMASQICRKCQRQVASYFLIQPKERTRADLIRQRLKELHKIKNMEEEFPKTEENVESIMKT